MMIRRALRSPLAARCSPRNLGLFLSTKNGADLTATSSVEWRKEQLDQLERKFSDPQPQAMNDEDLQPAWKAMESRVTKRRSLTTEQRRGKTGRSNIRRTEEEVWLESGLYDDDSKNDDKNDKAT